MAKFSMNKALGALSVMAVTMMASPVFAQGRNAGAIADDLAGQVGGFSTLATVIAFVAGVVIAMIGLMKFRAHSQNPNDPSNKLSSAFVLIFVGASLVAIPAVLGVGINTVFGTGAGTTDATDGFRSLGR